MVSVSLPPDPSVLRGVAALLERSGAWHALATMLDAWQPLEPGNAQLRVRRYGAWLAAGEEQKALACIREAAATAGNGAELLRLAKLLQRGGHVDAVAQLLEQAVEDAPNDWRLALEFATSLPPGEARNHILQRTFSWPSQTSAARAAMLRRLLAEDRRDDARTALAALFSAQVVESSRASNARRAVIEQLIAAGEDDLVDAALAGYARHAPAGLATYLSSKQALPHHDALRASMGRIRASGLDTLSFELAVLQALEIDGRHAEADLLQHALDPRMTVEAEPSEASPTPSTMMFRNRPLLDALVVAIGWFAERCTSVRVHVAGCSTGEEAFSLALALQQAGLIDRCDLSASDVDPALVRRARTGVVDKKAMQPVPEDMLAFFERRRDGRFSLAPEILGRISFSVQDLLRRNEDGAEYQVFIANNVLVHFPVHHRKEMSARIAERVAGGGLLCLGGSRQDGLEDQIEALGLVPVVAGSARIFDAWGIQRNGWYVNPRPYWALPPSRLTASCPWKHVALFARGAETAAALEELLADGV